MDQQQPRGRGRARGRARGPPTGGAPGQAPQPRPGPRPPQAGPRPQGPWGAPAQGAWSGGAPHHTTPAWQPPQQQQPPAGAWGGQHAQPPTEWAPAQQQSQAKLAPEQKGVYLGGRANVEKSKAAAEGEIAGAIISGGDTALMHSGRGAMRGRRNLTELQTYYKTKPQHLQTKQGVTGGPIRLQANYFKLEKMTNWCLYQSRVDFSPNEDQTVVRKKLLRVALKEILPVYVFDGTVLYASQRLDPDPFEVFAESPTQEGVKIRITIKRVGDLSEGDYHFLQFFNIIMRKCMGFLKLQLVGRNFFDAAAKIMVPNYRMELWPGYVTSIRQHEEAILMCVEISTKFMRVDTCLHLLNECIQEDRSQYQKGFQSKVIGTVVLTDYNNRTYHIDDIDWNSNPSSTFKRSDGSEISYSDYFKERYGLNITDRKQPMLVSRSKPRELRAGMPEIVYLVPELCRLTGLTQAQRNNFQLMRALAEHTRVGPRQRIEKLIKFSQRLRGTPQIVDELKAWDMQLSSNLVQFEGRVLKPEMIHAGGDQKYSAGEQAGWTRELRARPMIHDMECSNWVMICPQRFRQQAESFAGMLFKAAKGMSWRLERPTIFDLRDDRPGPYMEMLENVIQKQKPKMILCAVSNIKADRYSAIKKKCCVDKGVPSQVVVAKNLEGKESMSIATKVAIQMNCKLGGAPWTVGIPITNMMIVGFDVCHDPQDKTKSYGALVASLDKHATRYCNNVSAHMAGEEISYNFALNMVKACKTWQKHNGQLPEKILIYRDGVGDGQIPYCKEQEVEHMKKVLRESLYGDDLKLCFVVVSKRINTRIFAGHDNPPPGTIVDSCVTLPERYDFFIVSQCVRQGTVAPTSYNVIEDNMGLSVDHLQRLTYKLTHMYFNWSGTVRVPAPCQYAHKLAFLVSQSLHKEPHPDLDTVLYYL